MPDETDRFGGLGDVLEEGEREEEVEDGDTPDADAGETTAETADTDATAAASTPATEPSVDTDEGTDGAGETDDSEEYPEPFGFAETSQQSYYVRDETFSPISSNRSRVRAVASKHGLDEDDLSKRELHDAELAVLQSMDDWDIAVAMEVLERRGVNADEDTVRSVYDVLR